MALSRARLSLFAALLAATAWVACGLVEPEPLLVDASVPHDADLPSACAACLVAACTNVYAQCEQSSDCYDRYQSVLESDAGPDDGLCPEVAGQADPLIGLARCAHGTACGAGACTVACKDDDAGLLHLAACGLSVPSAGCDPGSGSGSGEAASAGSTAACDSCVSDHCATFVADCGRASDCQKYLACLATCTGTVCVEECATGPTAAGLAPADALDVCVGATCAEPCGF